MKIVILGGSGLIGKALARNLSVSHEVQCLNRSAFKSVDVLFSLLNDCDLVIQLSGSTIAKRWTKKHLKEVWESRVDTTQMLSTAISMMTTKPRVMCASGVSFYPESDCSNPYSENDKKGEGYLTELSVAWESAAKSISEDIIILRFGVVLSRSGGAFMKLYWPYFFGLGGPIASGSQCFSWIHINDLVRSVDFIINNGQFSILATAKDIVSEVASQFAGILKLSISFTVGIHTNNFLLLCILLIFCIVKFLLDTASARASAGKVFCKYRSR